MKLKLATRTRSFYKDSIILSIIFGLVHSVFWLLPTSYTLLVDSNFVYSPIHYGHTDTSDNYFYYARVRDVIDGLIFSHDPVVSEYRSTITPHSSYISSFWIAGLSGVVSDFTEHAFFFNNFFYPAITLLLCCLLLRRLAPDEPMVLVGALAATAAGITWTFSELFYCSPPKGPYLIMDLIDGLSGFDLLSLTQLTRMPNIQITAPLQLLLIILLLRFDDNRHSLSSKIVFSTVLSLNVLSSSSNCLFALILICLYLIFRLLTNKPVSAMLQIVGMALAPILYAVYIASAALFDTTALLRIATEVPKDNSALTGRVAVELVTLALPLVASFLLRMRFSTVIRCSLAAALVSYIVAFAMGGWFFAARTVSRGSDITVGLLGIYTAGRALRTYDSSIAQKATSRCAFLLCLFILSIFSGNQVVIHWNSVVQLNDRPFSRVCAWLRENTNPQETIVTIDADLIYNLPACSPPNQYIPLALLSGTPRSERFERFFEVAALYGLSFRESLNLLTIPDRGDKSTSQLEYRNSVLMRRILFYGQYIEQRLLPAEAITELETAFNGAEKSLGQLKHNHDYLIIGPIDRGLIVRGSVISKLTQKLSSLFEADGYQIVKMSDFKSSQVSSAN